MKEYPPQFIMKSVRDGLDQVGYALEDAEKVVDALKELRKVTTEEDWDKMNDMHQGFLMELLDAACDLEETMKMDQDKDDK